MTNEEHVNTPDEPTPDAIQPDATEAVAESLEATSAAEAVTAEPQVSSEQQELAIRRAPKFSVFIVLGIIFGLIVAVILTFSFPEVEGKTNWNQVFGFLFLPGAAIGAALGAIWALILDRRSRSKKRSGHIIAEHIEVQNDTEE